jgi:hypothetical protein
MSKGYASSHEKVGEKDSFGNPLGQPSKGRLLFGSSRNTYTYISIYGWAGGKSKNYGVLED